MRAVVKSKLFFVTYTLLISVIYVLALPFAALLARKPKYRTSIPARFFLRHNPPLPKHGHWFHGCSFGEVASLKPLQKEFDDFAVTTTTQTGLAEAKKLSANARYLPFEPLLFFWMRRQKVLVVLEAELWYLLFALAKRKGTPTLLLSARISDNSYEKYYKARWFYKRLFANVDRIYAQSQKDKLRFEALGAQNVVVGGNIKLANLPSRSGRYAKPKQRVITVASSHEGEEEKVLQAFDAAALRDTKLIIVPRHPERFDAVDALIQRYRGKRSYHRFSERKDFDSEIVLVDAMGELIHIYEITDVTILCGAFAPIGGHNPIEPAFFHNKIISGEHYFNQKETYKCVDGIHVTNDLEESLKKLDALNPTAIEGSFDLQSVVEDIKALTRKENASV